MRQYIFGLWFNFYMVDQNYSMVKILSHCSMLVLLLLKEGQFPVRKRNQHVVKMKLKTQG